MSTPTSADTLPVDDPIVEEAAEWLVRLSGKDAHAGDFAAFESWKQSDTRRAEAAERMCGLIERLNDLRATGNDTRALHATLNAIDGNPKKRPRSPLQRLGATLALVLTLLLPGWLVLQKYPPAYLLADVRTAAGQPETRRLADSTELTLKGASAVNLHYDDRQRTVELMRGEILLDVTRDAQRPFVVETRHGSIRALGTRFAVQCDDSGTLLTMLESRTSIKATTSSGQKANELVVSAGQRVHIDAGGIGAIESINADSIADAWKFNQLVVQNVPLPEVLDELASQRAGIIRYDRAALAEIRVSAVLPLGDTDQALRLLSASHPIQITRFTPLLISVAAAPKK